MSPARAAVLSCVSRAAILTCCRCAASSSVRNALSPNSSGRFSGVLDEKSQTPCRIGIAPCRAGRPARRLADCLGCSRRGDQRNRRGDQNAGAEPSEIWTSSHRSPSPLSSPLRISHAPFARLQRRLQQRGMVLVGNGSRCAAGRRMATDAWDSGGYSNRSARGLRTGPGARRLRPAAGAGCWRGRPDRGAGRPARSGTLQGRHPGPNAIRRPPAGHPAQP